MNKQESLSILRKHTDLSILWISLCLIGSSFVILSFVLPGFDVPMIFVGLLTLTCIFIWIALKKISYWILITIFLMPFVFYIRQFIPNTIYLGGIPFVASGVIKEFLAISVLVLILPIVIKKLSLKFFSFPLVIYVLVTFVAALRLGSVIEMVSYLRMAYIGLIYYIVGPYVYKKPIIQYLAIMMIILGIMDALLGLYRYFYNPLFLYVSPELVPVNYQAYQSFIYRLNGIFPVNQTAFVAALSVFSTLVYGRKIAILKLFWAPLLGLFIFTLVLTQSRTGLILFIQAIIIWLVIESILNSRSISKVTVFIAIGFVTALAVIAVPSDTKSVVFGRLFDLALNPIAGRGATWPALFSRLSGLDFVFGKGLDALGGMGTTLLSTNAIQVTADNLPLQFLVTMGFIGLVPFVAFVFIVIRRGVASVKKIPNLKKIVLVEKKRSLSFSLGILIMCLTASIAGVTIQEPYFGALFWLTAGFISCNYLDKEPLDVSSVA